MLRIGVLERLQRVFVLGRRHLLQQLAQFQILRPDRDGSQLGFSAGRPGCQAEFVANENRFERQRRQRALVADDFDVQHVDRFCDGRVLIRQIGQVFQQFVGHTEPRFQTFGRAEIANQTLLQRNLLRLINNRVGLFRGHEKMAVLFQLMLGHLPPFLPVVCDDVRHEHLLDLLQRRLAAEALEHELDEIEVVQRRHLAQRLEVRRLARQNVVAGYGFERLRSEAQVHRMPRLVWEVNGQPRENRVHCLDFAEAPASVHGVAALHQLQQRFNVLTADLAGGNQFLQLFFHNSSKNSLAMKRMSL